MDEQWREYQGDYEVSNKGRVRRATDSNNRIKRGYLMMPTDKSGTRTPFYHFYHGTRRVGMSVLKLMNEVWPGVEIRPDRKWSLWVRETNQQANRTIISKKRSGKKKESTSKPRGNVHECAGGCGRMITNYRCDNCWREIRAGYGDWVPAPEGYRVARGIGVF